MKAIKISDPEPNLERFYFIPSSLEEVKLIYDIAFGEREVYNFLNAPQGKTGNKFFIRLEICVDRTFDTASTYISNDYKKITKLKEYLKLLGYELINEPKEFKSKSKIKIKEGKDIQEKTNRYYSSLLNK